MLHGCAFHIYMKLRSINTLSKTCGVMLFICLVVFFVLAVTGPIAITTKSKRQLDEKILSIKSESDIAHLQQRAIMDVVISDEMDRTAAFVWRISFCTLFLLAVGSAINLVQVRRIKRQLSDTNNTAEQMASTLRSPST